MVVGAVVVGVVSVVMVGTVIPGGGRCRGVVVGVVGVVVSGSVVVGIVVVASVVVAEAMAKTTVADTFASGWRTHVFPSTPAQASRHAVSTNPLAGEAVSVTSVPGGTVVMQVESHVISPGCMKASPPPWMTTVSTTGSAEPRAAASLATGRATLTATARAETTASRLRIGARTDQDRTICHEVCKAPGGLLRRQALVVQEDDELSSVVIPNRAHLTRF